MASETIWHYTGLPTVVIDAIEKDLEWNFDSQLDTSKVGHKTAERDEGNFENRSVRNAKNAWVPTTHWLGGFCWHYVMRANRENFRYDLSHVHDESLQYTVYGEGEYYGWHTDADLNSCYTPIGDFQKSGSNTVEQLQTDEFLRNSETVRKLSFSLLLSDPDTYQGGNFEFKGVNEKAYLAPRHRGTIILFDSRTKHRVTKVTKGVRKSIVGWVVGPRWK